MKGEDMSGAEADVKQEFAKLNEVSYDVECLRFFHIIIRRVIL